MFRKWIGCLIALGVWAGAITTASQAVGARTRQANGRQSNASNPRPRATSPARAPGPSMTSAECKSVVDKYCVSCHSDRLKTGGVTFEGIDFADIPANAETLEKAVRKLLVGAMPPQGVPRPDPATYHALAASLESSLDRAAAAKSDPGRAILRRLNRTEYANAVRDLLDLDVNVSTLLPVDNSSYGFDNIGDVLGMSPVLMERYLTAARRISAVAVGDKTEIVTTAETYRVRPDLSQDRHVEGLPLGTRGGILVKHTFPLDAEYAFKIDLRQTTLNNVVGLEYPHRVVMTVDGAEVHRASIGGKDDLVTSFGNSQATAELLEARLAVRLTLKAGPHDIGAAFIEKSAAMRPGVLQPILRTTFDPVNYTGEPHIEALIVTGPFNETGPGDTPSRRRVFVCRPATVVDESPCATRILSTIARGAYRRPLAQEDLQTLANFYQMGRKKGTFDSGIEMGLRRILASPDFVLRIERDPINAVPGSVHRITDFELASRLSFFLWSTLPDDQLWRVAGQGRLSDPLVLERQVRRMVMDPRSRALVDNFAGQWLYLRNLRNINPAPTEFPDFDHNLRLAMLREMEMFFGSIIHEDRSVMDLMTANDTFVNERLARHYGIPNIYGGHFRRVTLVEDERRGLLGKGAILLVTSLATRTSPVVRGKWILENIVGTPPPPPLPNVPALDENMVGERPRALRERMETHRRNPVCASCHRLMDPIGFALENYDAVGQWRTNDDGAPIDAAGQLMDGSKVDGPVTLRQALTRNPEVFVRTMTEKMMIYALGRGLNAHDMASVRSITRSAARNNYRFSSLVIGIVESVPFQMKMVASLDEGESGRETKITRPQ
jgi:mono/diheme cytochrome c family protein